MERLTQTFETFIKKPQFQKQLRIVLAALILLSSIIGFSTGHITTAQAPTDAELKAQFEAERTLALEKLALEMKQLAFDNEEILYLARVIYSETKRPSEMPYIAWVIRNRVEMGHRAFDYEVGKNSYKGAALAKSQFSGMNPNLDRNATRNLAMDFDVVGDYAWDQAVKVAEEVYFSDGSDRVLAADVTHFYSPYIAPPAWAYKGTKVYEAPERRFAFYSGVVN